MNTVLITNGLMVQRGNGNESVPVTCPLLDYYTASSVTFLRIFFRYYHCSLCKNPTERSSQLLRGGSLKSRNLPQCHFVHQQSDEDHNGWCTHYYYSGIT